MNELKLKGKVFKAVVATPGAGKSFLADNYPIFADVDEMRMKSKYIVPENATREELEKTKGKRPYSKRENFEPIFYEKLNNAITEGKILLCSPLPEVREFLFKNKIPYLFVYPKYSMKKEMKERMEKRQNTEVFITRNDELFDFYYHANSHEPYATVKYRLHRGEYLKDVLIKAGLKL